MNRCVLAAALHGAACALPVAAQVRAFPPDALRGELRVTQPPEVLLNGQPARLAPGARIHGEDNLLRLSGALAGTLRVVHYTLDGNAQLREVWLLSDDERRLKPWPATAQEAQRWLYDPVTHTWTRR